MICLIMQGGCSKSFHANSQNDSAKKHNILTQSITDDIEKKEVLKRTVFPDNSIYENKEAGYRIIFPEYWSGNYVISEYGAGKVCIGFYGESKTGQIAYKHSLNRYGLDMCWIMKRVPLEGCLLWGEIGEVNGEKYFITSPIGGTYLPELQEVLNKDSISRKTANYVIDENELNLINNDIKKAIPMRDDLYAYETNITFELID